MLGAIQAIAAVASDDALAETLKDFLGEEKSHLLEVNELALARGRAAVNA